MVRKKFKVDNPFFARKLTFERGLVLAEEQRRVLESSSNLMHWWPSKRLKSIASGTMAVYELPGKRFEDKVECNYGRKRWVFLVPEKYRGKANALLTVNHPFWFLEIDKNNRVIHVDDDKVNIVENFDRSRDFRTFISSPISNSGKGPKMTVKSFIKTDGTVHFNDGCYSGYTNYHGAFIHMWAKGVGPIILSKDDRHPYISHLSFFFYSVPYNLIVGPSLEMLGVLSLISDESPIRALRGLGKEIELSHVADLITGARLSLIPGSALSILGKTESFYDLFSCYQGTCGKCFVRVETGANLLTSPTRAELEYRDNYWGLPPSNIEQFSLLCQSSILKPGILKIEPQE